jgi:hypothetical protein
MENNFKSHCPCADLIKSIGGCMCYNMEMRRVNDRSDSYIKFHIRQMNLMFDRNAKKFKTTTQ